MTRHSPLQQLKEAHQIARDHSLRLVEVKQGTSTFYVLYRLLPAGGDVRLGKRSSPEGIRRFVAKCADFR